MRVAQPIARGCAAPTLPDPGAGATTRVQLPRVAGFLTVSSTGSDASDWDLALYDMPSGRLIAASQAFGSREVVQAWVVAERPVVVRACRRHGPATRLRVAARLLPSKRSAPREAASLVRVPFGSSGRLHALEALGVDVTENIHDGEADVVLGSGDATRLGKAGFAFRTLVPDLDAHYVRARWADMEYAARVGGVSPLPSGRTAYRTYEDIQAELKTLAERNPALVRPLKLPKRSYQGRELSGIEIAADVATVDGRPEFLLLAMHHAREWPSDEVAMEFAHMLVQSYGRDARITDLLHRVRVVVVPLINPDGFISTRTTGAVDPAAVDPAGALSLAQSIAPPGGILGYRRKNCAGAIRDPSVPCEFQHGVDPNRNYGQFWGGPGSSADPLSQTYRGLGPWSEPETQAVHEYSQHHAITTLITLHNVAALVLRPPGTSVQGEAPDEERLRALGDAMGNATGYRSQFGYQLYDTSGTTEDWNYAAAGTFGFTIEIGPSRGAFHMPYEIGVVKEWTGSGNGGLREALILAAENAADPRDHSIVAVHGAKPGASLRLHKDFTTPTKETCSLSTTGGAVAVQNAPCEGETIPAQQITDFFEFTAQVPANGELEWHVTPSTRPFVSIEGGTERYSLTCGDGGPVLSVIVARGQRRDVYCGPPATPARAPRRAQRRPRKKATACRRSPRRTRKAKSRRCSTTHPRRR